MGIINWFRKKKDTVENTFEAAEQEEGCDQETVQSNPFQVVQEESGGCCGGGGCGSKSAGVGHEQESSGCGSGGCGSETPSSMSGGGGCCSGESTSVLAQVTPQTTLREAGQNPMVLEMMLKSGLPFGCGMKQLSIQEAGQYAGLKNAAVKKLIMDINHKLGNGKTPVTGKTKQTKTVRAHRNRETISGARNSTNSRAPAGGKKKR